MSPSWRGMPFGSAPSPSIGKASASVASSTPRCSRFRARLSSGSTNASPSSPSPTPSPASTDCASATAAASSTSHPERLSTSTQITVSKCSPAPLGPGLLGVGLVRLDDPLYELVSDDVLVAELYERDAVDRRED